MNIYVPWIKGRKTFILRCFCDFLIFFLFFSRYELISISLLISLVWCLSNYLIGIYHNKILKFKIKKIINLFIFKNITSLFAILIFIRLLIIFNLINYELRQFFPSIIWIAFLASFLQQLISIFFRKKNTTIFHFFGSDYMFKKVSNWFRKIDHINIKITSSYELKKNIKADGYIFENIEYFGKDLQDFLLKESINGKQIFNLVELSEAFLSRIPSDIIFGKDLIKINFASQVSTFQFRLKRIGDILFSFILIFSLFPILIAAALLIYLEDRGPIFYSQRRSGLMNESFYIIKLRTMYINAEENGPQWSTNKDKRITKIGKLLRKYRLDELPQLLNVLKGEMSLIGPRPERPEIDKNLSKEINNYDLKYLAKPGLSGWAQVNYPYGASVEDAKMKLSYDLYYIKHFSIFLDLLIFFKTIKLVFNAEGSIPN